MWPLALQSWSHFVGLILNVSIIFVNIYSWVVFVHGCAIVFFGLSPARRVFLPYYDGFRYIYIGEILGFPQRIIVLILVAFMRWMHTSATPFDEYLAVTDGRAIKILLILIVGFNLVLSYLTLTTLGWDSNMGGSFRSSWARLTSVDPFSGVAYSMVDVEPTRHYNVITMPFREYVWLHVLINLQAFVSNWYFNRYPFIISELERRIMQPFRMFNQRLILYVFFCLGTLGLRGTMIALEPLISLFSWDVNPLFNPVNRDFVWVREICTQLRQFIRALFISSRVPYVIPEVQVIVDAPAALIDVVRPEIPANRVPSALTPWTIVLTILYYVVSALVFNRLGGNINPPNPLLKF